MDSSKNTNTINKLLAVLNLLFGGFSLTIGLIGLFGYAGIKELSYTLFVFRIGNDISPFSISPLIIISLFFIIFSFVAFGAGFSFIKEETSAVKKSRLASILFLILFLANTIFSVVAIFNMNLIDIRKSGNNNLTSNNIIMSKVESAVLKKKNDTIKFNKQGLTLPELNTTNQYTQWLIIPMKVKEEIFKTEILAKLTDDNVKKLFERNYEYDTSERVYYFISDKDDLENSNKLKEQAKKIFGNTKLFSDSQGFVKIDKKKYEEIKGSDSDLKSFIDNNYEYVKSEDAYLIKDLYNKIIIELIDIGYLNGFRVDTLIPDSTLTEIPNTLFYLDPIGKDKWEIAYILQNDENSSMHYAKYYLFTNKYDLISEDEIKSKTEHKYEFELNKGETVYLKVDSYENENLRENKIFWKLYVNQDGTLERNGKEISQETKRQLGKDLQIIDMQKQGENKLKITVGFEADDEINTDLKLYNLDPEKAKRKILPRAPYMQKIVFDAQRDGVYQLEVTYDKALPFSLPFYIFIFIVTLVVPLLILLLTLSSTVREWVHNNKDNYRPSPRPDVLSQITGLNILLVPLQILLATTYLESILQHQPQKMVLFIIPVIQFPSQLVWVILGLIGVLIIVNSIIGLISSYSIMSYSGRSKFLIKSFSSIAIILLLVAFILKIHSLNAIPNSTWTGIQALYNGINPSLNYIPAQKHLFAIFIFASNLAFTGILLIYPLYIRSKIKGENIKNYLDELKEKESK